MKSPLKTLSVMTDIQQYLLCLLFVCLLIPKSGMSTVTSNNTILAAYNVSLEVFTSETSDESVILHWTTLSENNNRCFLVERSLDAIDFTCLDTISGNGTTTNKSDYSYTDKKPEIGISYYRITHLDINGYFTRCNIIAVNFIPKKVKCGFSKVNIYPIPFNETISVDLVCAKEAHLTLQINGTTGKKVFDCEINCYAGMNSYHFNDLRYINDGVYFITISDSNGCQVKFNSIKKNTD